MDDAWLWGILFAIAAMIAPVTASMAPTLIDRSPRGAWWCIILAPAPLIAWNIAWVVMSNPPDNIRRTATVVIGAVAGALILLGVTELLRRPADAQQRPQPKSTEILMSQSSDLSPPVNTGPESIVTFGQSGGVNTVYNGERLADLGSDALLFVKTKIPEGSKIIMLRNVNDSPTAEMEKRLTKLLVDGGYKMGGSGFTVGGQYFKGIQVNEKPNANGEYTIVIGDPRAN
jgi:hypothetical protein